MDVFLDVNICPRSRIGVHRCANKFLAVKNEFKDLVYKILYVALFSSPEPKAHR